MKSLYLEQWDAFIRYHDIDGDETPIVYLASMNYPSAANLLTTATHPKLRGHRSILIDYIGVGYSEHAPNFSHSMQDHARTIACVLDHEGIKDCIIVGHSMGGTVGIYLAEQRPDLVSHLFVCEGNITPGGGGLSRRIIANSESDFVDSFFPTFRTDLREKAIAGNKILQWLLGGWETADAVGIYRAANALVNLDEGFKDLFFSIPTKRTFVWGEESLPENTGKITPDAPDPYELKENGIATAVVSGVGHTLMLSDLDAFVNVVSERISSES